MPLSGASRRRATCRLCASDDLGLVLSLAPTPPANEFVPAHLVDLEQEVFPLDVALCSACGHVQLLDVIDPMRLFGEYVYVSGTSPVFVQHFRDYAAEVIARFELDEEDLVIDVGSNDGTLLRFFAERGCRVLGVDPARSIADTATAAGIPTIAQFFTPTLAATILRNHGFASVITANNVFAHIDDLTAVVEGVRSLLSPKGHFVFEVSYLADVVENLLFDTIYHEHLSYHSVGPLRRFLGANGLELVAVRRIDTHGGSIRCYARLEGAGTPERSVVEFVELEKRLGLGSPATFQKLDGRIRQLAIDTSGILRPILATGTSVAGFGAPAKATTLLHQFQLGDALDFIVDDSPLKQGLYTPGHHIPVLSSSALRERDVKRVLILAWNFADSIIERNRDLLEKGCEFITPLPMLKVHAGVHD